MNADVINSSRMSGPVLFIIGLAVAMAGSFFALQYFNPNLDGIVNWLTSMGVQPGQLLYVAGAVIALAVLIPFFKGGQSNSGNDFAEGEEMVDTGPSYFSQLGDALMERSATIGKIVWFVAILFACNSIAAVFMGYEWMSHYWFYAMLVAFCLEAMAVAVFHRRFHLDKTNQDRQYFALMLGLTIVGAAVVSQISAQLNYKVFGIEPMYLFFHVAGVAFAVWLVAHPICALKRRNFATVSTSFVVVFAPFWVSVTFMGKFGWSELTFLIPIAAFWAAIVIGLYIKKR